MKKDQIARAINPDYPFIYAPTTEATKIVFNDDKSIVGFFQFTDKSDELEKNNEYTFIEFNNAQAWRVSKDEKYVTTVKGNDIKEVIYPSFPVLDRLRNIKKKLNEQQLENWDEYKINWQNSVKDLFNTICYKWFSEYENDLVMKFSLIPVSRQEEKLGSYLTMILEIQLVNEQVLVFEPIAGVTSEYFGRIDFYIRGNMYKTATIYRKKVDNQLYWFIGLSYAPGDQYPLSKTILESLISKWL